MARFCVLDPCAFVYIFPTDQLLERTRIIFNLVDCVGTEPSIRKKERVNVRCEGCGCCCVEVDIMKNDVFNCSEFEGFDKTDS